MSAHKEDHETAVKEAGEYDLAAVTDDDVLEALTTAFGLNDTDQ